MAGRILRRTANIDDVELGRIGEVLTWSHLRGEWRLPPDELRPIAIHCCVVPEVLGSFGKTLQHRCNELASACVLEIRVRDHLGTDCGEWLVAQMRPAKRAGAMSRKDHGIIRDL